MSYCKFLKQKLNKKIYCNRLKKEIKILECTNCKYKEYLIKTNLTKLKKKRSKLAKLERNRYSILTNDLEHCFICGKPKNDLHEIFFGRNRLNSIKYGLILPLCRFDHEIMHNDLKFRKKYFILAQKKFNEVYPDLDFVEIFGKNYLK